MAQGEYANFAIITHSSSDFVVDFARVLPGVPKAMVRSRILLAPEHAKRLLAALQEKGFDWPDHKPEHFFVMNDGSIGLIDLERLRFIGQPLCEAKCATQLEKFRSLLPKK